MPMPSMPSDLHAGPSRDGSRPPTWQQLVLARLVLLTALVAACSAPPPERFEGTEPGDCDDAADNDHDGLFDCADPGCGGSPRCADAGPRDAGLDASTDAASDAPDAAKPTDSGSLPDGTIEDGGVGDGGAFDGAADAAAPGPSYVWARRFGGPTEALRRTVTNAAGRIVLLGTFAGSIDFGGGPMIASTTEDTFIVALDATGALVWAHHFSSTSYLGATDIAIDASGNVYVTGSFDGSVDFGGGALVATGMYDGFVASLDPTGTYRWSRHWGGAAPPASVQPFSIAVDDTGRTYCTGLIRDTVHIGTTSVTSIGLEDVLIVALDAGGVERWATSFGTLANDDGSVVTVDGAGNLLVGGTYQSGTGALDLGGGPLSSTDSWAAFLASFSPSGTYRWSRLVGAGTLVDPTRIVDAAGVVSVFGYVGLHDGSTAMVDFGPGVGALSGTGGTDAYVLALNDATDVSIWARVVGGSANERSVGGLLDPTGAVLAGTFETGLDFGGGPVVGHGMFVAAYSATSAYRWAWTNPTPGIEDIAALPARNVLVAGVFNGSADFGGGPLLSVGPSDIFLLALAAP